jgi:hypothetical protein
MVVSGGVHLSRRFASPPGAFRGPTVAAEASNSAPAVGPSLKVAPFTSNGKRRGEPRKRKGELRMAFEFGMFHEFQCRAGKSQPDAFAESFFGRSMLPSVGGTPCDPMMRGG